VGCGFGDPPRLYVLIPQSLRLVTLGPPALSRGSAADQGVTVFGPSKPLALITFLALVVGHRASRDQLVDLLWSDMDPERARQTLRQTAWQIRHRLGDHALVGEKDKLSLGIELSVDRDAFLAALAEGDLERAVRLYTGPFFTSFAAPGAVEFEHWADLEREHLQANYRQALESLARERLASGRFRHACEYAVVLRDDGPTREASWRLLLECLLAAGDSWNAGVEAAKLEHLLAESGREPEHSTLRLLEATRAAHTKPAHAERPPLGAELIGREAEFATILKAWEVVRTGEGQHIHLVAPAGLGKSRVLRDVRNRLAAGGARVVLARAQPAERRLAYAFVAEIAHGLSEQPGAVGVSPEAASALVALAPAISSRLPASADTATGDEALRRRTLALGELLASVSDEHPTALLLDDVHWADASSTAILEALLHRLAETRVLAVTAERPSSRPLATTSRTVTLELRALTGSECEDFMTSCGALPDEPWGRTIGIRLAEATGGSPLLLLETLQLCLDNRWLELDGTWRCPHPDRIDSALVSGGAVRRRLEALEASEADLLLVIACAGTPVSLERLASAASRHMDEVAARLEQLEHRGFVARSGHRWEVSHDEIAEAALAAAGPETQRHAYQRLGVALVDDPGLEVAEYPLAVDHLVRGGAEQRLTGLYARYLMAMSGTAALQDDEDLALAMLGEHESKERVRRLLKSRPLARRIRPRSLLLAAGALAALLGGVGVLLRAIGSPTAAAPVHAALIVAPVEAHPTLIPSPVVELQDEQGRRVPWAEDTVYVGVSDDLALLKGVTARRAHRGRATFDGLDVVATDSALQLGQPVVLRFWAKGLQPTNWTLSSNAPSTLRLEQGTLNGQAVTPAHREVIVTAGDSIVGDIHLRYTSTWSAAAVMLGGTPTWGDKRSRYFTIKPLVTPIQDGRQHVTIRLAGPSRPGRYHLILFFQAEPDVKYIASGTNWTVGRPVWGDGNDVADWSPAQLAAANAHGRTPSKVLRVPQGVATQYVAATVFAVLAK